MARTLLFAFQVEMMTESEQIVYDLSRTSFLSIWSYPNPLNSAGKELCDVLVVCDPDIIIFSVKEIIYRDSGRPEIDSDRWKRAAIDESCKQVYGAERAIDSLVNVIASDGNTGIRFPSKKDRTIYRVAVALGSRERAPLTFGNFGKGFVHVFDEKSLDAIMSELDTITDFVGYLSSKEEYYSTGNTTLFSGEEDLLAFYVVEGYDFPSGPDMMIFDEGLWSGFAATSEMKTRMAARKVSYVWDNLIERAYENFVNDNYQTPWANDVKGLDQLELAVRAMAREPRKVRTAMGERLLELFEITPKNDVRARIFCTSGSPIRYMFMTANYGANRELNFKELQARCLVARGLDHSKSTVIGVLVERSEHHNGDAVSILYVDVKEWTKEWQERMDLYQYELGYFKNSRRTALQSNDQQ